MTMTEETFNENFKGKHMLSKKEQKLKDAYDASELVCCDLQQALNENQDRDQRHNIEATLSNAEKVRDYLLEKGNFTPF